MNCYTVVVILSTMINTVTRLAEQPVTKTKYKQSRNTSLPRIIMGFVMKNKYDEKRLCIKKMLRPVNVSHTYVTDNKTETMHIHGVWLNPQPIMNRLCETISRAKPLTSQSYINILKYSRLSCNNCLQHLRDGVYPMDITCLPLLSKNKFKSDYLYLRSLLDHNNQLPWFSSWSEFNIFMLCPSFIEPNNYK